MGNDNSSENSNNNGSFPWPQEKIELAEASLNCGDPRVVNFRNFKYPIEDPIDMIVKDTESDDDIRLKNYLYPANYERIFRDN